MAPKKILHSVYFSSTVFTFHVALLTFINSSFLEGFISVKFLGFVFMAGSLGTILLITQMPRLLARFGNFSVTVGCLLFSILALVGMLASAMPAVVVALFIAYSILSGGILLNFDIYIEEFTPRDTVGATRGVFLTFCNLAWVISQLLVATFLTGDNYWKIYLLSISFGILALIFVFKWLRRVPDITYTPVPLLEGLKIAWGRWNVRHIVAINLLLQFFFGWMVIYSPIYLHENVGFGWSSIGIIFTIMLLPYVLFEIPLGKLADVVLGEKEILIIGFIITALATMTMAFMQTRALVPWIIVLFATRMGSSFIEIMTETYFFKKIKTEDTTTLEIFRITRPAGYILAPLVASMFIPFVEPRFLFLVLGTIMLAGIYASSRIVDTK